MGLSLHVYIARRLMIAIPTLLGVVMLTFALGYFGPGDPVRIAAEMQGDQNPDEETVQRLRKELGLDRPFLVQFGDYLGKLAKGDLGTSLSVRRNQKISDMIKRTLPVSLQLGVAATVIVGVVGIPLGLLAAMKRNTWIDYVIVAGAAILPTVPVFVLAPLSMILFVLKLGWIKASFGWGGTIFHEKAILPLFLLCIGPMLVVVRQTRGGVLEVMPYDYIRTARAKGLPERIVVLKHVLRNAMTPVITSLGLIFGGLITGALFVESIFGIPGLGGLIYLAFRARDYPLIMGTTVFVAVAFSVANLLVDVSYKMLDPRVRLE